MSDTLGAVNYTSHNRAAFLENPFASERGNYSEDTAVRIDAEVKRILQEAHDTARRELKARRHVLDQLAQRLLEIEVIEAEELQRIMNAESTDHRPATDSTDATDMAPAGRTT
jgi:cell division protease FtsH